MPSLLVKGSKKAYPGFQSLRKGGASHREMAALMGTFSLSGLHLDHSEEPLAVLAFNP